MLATPYHASAPAYHQREFLPKIPSPLSPRSANLYGGSARQQQPIFMNGSDASKSQPQPQQQAAAPVAYSKRAIKRAPTVSQDALKERRRGMFLKKVREGREDKRFERHGEDIMRLDFVQRQKKWEAEQARSAPLLPSDAPEEDEEESYYGLPTSSNDAMQVSASPSQWQWQATPEDADAFAQRESEELEALLSLLPGEGSGLQQQPAQQQDYQPYQEAGRQDEPMSEHFGSDDDDYDALFSDFINAEAHDATEGDNTNAAPSGDAMDMS